MRGGRSGRDVASRPLHKAFPCPESSLWLQGLTSAWVVMVPWLPRAEWQSSLGASPLEIVGKRGLEVFPTLMILPRDRACGVCPEIFI